MKEKINHLAGSTFLLLFAFLVGGAVVSVIGWKLVAAICVMAFVVFVTTSMGKDYE